MAKQKKAPPPLLSVRAVLNDLQHGFESASHPRELWATCLQEPERFVQELLECLLLVVQAPEVRSRGAGAAAAERRVVGHACAATSATPSAAPGSAPYGRTPAPPPAHTTQPPRHTPPPRATWQECPAEEGVIRFFGRWVSCMPDGTDSDAAEDAIGCVLRALTGYLGHEEAHSRRRCMSMLFQALNCLPKEAALNSEVLAELAVCCATLLEDRDSKMRRMATMCLKHLIFVDEVGKLKTGPHAWYHTRCVLLAAISIWPCISLRMCVCRTRTCFPYVLASLLEHANQHEGAIGNCMPPWQRLCVG